MKKFKIITIQDGTTGEIYTSIDTEFLKDFAVTSIIQSYVYSTLLENEHDLIIKCGYKP